MSGVLLVEWTMGGSLDDYHHWYDTVHLREIRSLDGFTSARRLAEAGGDRGLAVYDFDGDADGAKAALKAFMRSGQMTLPPGAPPEPAPMMTWFTTVTTA